MKKLLLSLVAVFAAVSTAHAAPQFGIALTSADAQGIGAANPGIVIADTAYTVVASFKNTDTDGTKDTTIGLKANYNAIQFNKSTTGTVGVVYNTQSGDTNDKFADMRVIAGVSRKVASNINLNLDINVYQSRNVTPAGGSESKQTNLLNGGSIGLAILL